MQFFGFFEKKKPLPNGNFTILFYGKSRFGKTLALGCVVDPRNSDLWVGHYDNWRADWFKPVKVGRAGNVLFEKLGD